MKGWAHGDGTLGTQATNVQISIDGGLTWNNAHELLMEDKPKGFKVFSWTLWKYSLDISSMRGACSVQVRAVDSTGKVQDGQLENLYNLRGILNNAPHEVNFEVNT